MIDGYPQCKVYRKYIDYYMENEDLRANIKFGKTNAK